MFVLRSATLAVASLVFGSIVGCARAPGSRALMHDVMRETRLVESSAEPEFGETLEREEVVRAVLLRNPNVRAALLAWRAMSERTGRARALPDPRVEYAFAPLSIGSDNVAFGQRITVRQAFPFPGRRARREEVAVSRARESEHEYATLRLDLAIMASALFEQLVEAERALAVNTRHSQISEDLRALALDQLTAGRGSPSSPLAATVALRRAELTRISLLESQEIALARLNALMHRAPDAPLPPVLANVEERALPEADALRAARPEIAALEQRENSWRAEGELQRHERLPNFGVMATYSSMWRQLEHQIMVGVSIEVPLSGVSRNAAIRESAARVAQTRAARDALADQIEGEVATAYTRARRARESCLLIAEQVIPAARERIESARAAFVTGRGTFLAIIDAAHELHRVELDEVNATARARLAELSLVRALGRLAGLDSIDSLDTGEPR